VRGPRRQDGGLHPAIDRDERRGSGARAGALRDRLLHARPDRANKGKLLEPVKVTLTADKQTVIVDQYTRKLPPTRIPVSGGTVDFDQRFGTGAKCSPFRAQE